MGPLEILSFRIGCFSLSATGRETQSLLGVAEEGKPNSPSPLAKWRKLIPPRLLSISILGNRCLLDRHQSGGLGTAIALFYSCDAEVSGGGILREQKNSKISSILVSSNIKVAPRAEALKSLIASSTELHIL